MRFTRKKSVAEAGRRNSSVDQARIQEAHDHMVGLGAQCDSGTSESKEALRLAEALRVDDSFSARTDLLRKAARILLANASGMGGYDGPYCYVRDCFDADVIVQSGDDIYQIPYTISGETVTLGTPVEVDVAYIPATETAGDEMVERKRTRLATKKEMDSEKVTESAAVDLSGEFVQLREAAIGADGKGAIRIIKPGWGSSGYYSPEMLKRDGPKVFTKGTKMFWDHQTEAEEAARPEGSLDDLAAELSDNAYWDQNGPKGPALYAPIAAFEAYTPAINDLAKSIGVSIRAAGRASEGKAEGKTGPIIHSLESAKSIDFVTSPGAGGEILQLFEAARTRTPKTNQESEMEAKDLKEANAQLTAQEASIAKQADEIAKLRETVLLAEAARFVNHELTSAPLPGVTKQRLMRELIAAMPVKENALDAVAYKTRIDEAVKAAVAEIAAITGAGEVKGMGSAPTADDAKQLEESAKSLEASFATLGLSESAAKLAAKGRN